MGALLGGLSGSKTTHQRVTGVALRVTVEDRYEPLHVITFFSAPGGAEPVLAEPGQAAARVHAHLVNAMRQTARESAGQQAALGSADQLTKLWDMRQAGALTADEFEGQKARLLAGEAAAAAALPEPAAVGRRYVVMLVSAGPHPRRFAEALVREVPEITTMKNMTSLGQNLPKPILRDVGETRARKVQAALQEVGATVDVV
ncbi:hypothetical protein [Sphingomonas jatrophae]|uniref:Ribosomal protein L7/L12 C-terminal domain-containing protein n=1 Tax=Sphingomonas jatrophae TaxID=1166337 RepID=A0A1I6M7X3_9SPHN|nr:hypothetical protein [Sphingomonas jatrophae]SFS11708.1 hypothetical protein SAMN05192580_3626 [Sphingomonas jatrophae]